jgi:hypothetical protein
MKKLLLFAAVYFYVLQSVYSQQVLPNPGFEDWTVTGTYEDPDGWTTANSFSSLVGIELTTKATAPADVHSGNFALKTETIFIGAPVSQPVPGLVTTGTLHITTQTIDGGIAYTSRPDSIGGWYKYLPAGDDSAYVTFLMFSFFRDTIGRAVFIGGTTHGLYKWFSAPIVYELPDNPVTAYFMIAPSPRYGADDSSALWLDDMELIFATGLEEENSLDKKLSIYPNPASTCIIANNQTGKQTLLTVFDVNGKSVMEAELEKERQSIPLNLNPGLYVATFENEGLVLKTQKLVILH